MKHHVNYKQAVQCTSNSHAYDSRDVAAANSYARAYLE